MRIKSEKMANKDLQQKLAESLKRGEAIAHNGVIKSADLTRLDRERLLNAGWLQPIVKGWYQFGMQPEGADGSSTFWYSHFWEFVSYYLSDRFGSEYCLSSESSLDFHTNALMIPTKVVVITAGSGSSTLSLPHDTSLSTYSDPDNLPSQRQLLKGLQLMQLELALCRTVPRYFKTSVIDAELALQQAQPDQLSRCLLEGGHTRAASRLMGAYQFIGQPERASRIKEDMAAAGYRLSPVNPFKRDTPLLGVNARAQSPIVARLQAMWESMRPDVIRTFKHMKTSKLDPKTCLARIEDIYQHDAYNSLSIEGYQVTPELIEKVRIGGWDPNHSKQDKEHIAAMAAKGYRESYKEVLNTVTRLLKSGDPVQGLQNDLQSWYRNLFIASVQAGLLSVSDLAGYRNRPVYIRNSRHVPPAHEMLMDSMDTLFTCLQQEDEHAVRAVLGHFMFVFIHPYPDGNGRIARFLMNSQWVSEGYPWTIIRLENRNHYMQSLEQASVGGNIKPFSEFVLQEMQIDWLQQGSKP